MYQPHSPCRLALSPRFAASAVVAVLLLVAIPGAALHAQTGDFPAEPPAQPPADWGPVSINMEDVPYPFPVNYLEFEIFGKDVRKAYMDVEPTGTPNGQAVVLFHGAAYYAMYWEPTIESLREAGFRVVAPDLLGWGRSSKPIIPYSLSLHAGTIERLLDHLGISEAAVVGHSMGGMVATRFALMYPELTTHMVLVNPIGVQDSRPGWAWQEPSPDLDYDLQEVYESRVAREQRVVVDWQPHFLEHVRIHYGFRQSPDWPRLSYVQSLNSYSRAIDTVVHDWPLIETKSALLAGEEDGPNYPEYARNAVDLLPNAELVLWENIAHNPHLEIPDIFAAELIRFLESDPDESARRQTWPR